jgi:hypothetical protein
LLATVLAASAAFAGTQLLACSRCAQQRSAVPSGASADAARAEEVVPVGGSAEPEIQTTEGRADARIAPEPSSPFVEEAPDDEALEPRDLPGSAEDTRRMRGADSDERTGGTPLWPPEDYVEKDEGTIESMQEDEGDEPRGDDPEPLPIPGMPQDAGVPDAQNPYEDSPIEPDRILDAGAPTPSE